MGGKLPGEHDLRRDLEGEFRLGDLQADAAKLLGTARAHEEGDIPAGMGKACAEVATDGSGSDNENAHHELSRH
jgi:hypothetical protein